MKTHRAGTRTLLVFAALLAGCQGTIGPDGASGEATSDSGAPKRSNDASHSGGGDAREDSPKTDSGIAPPPPFAPTTAAAAVSKVKTVLTGLPPTEAEVSLVAADPAAIRGLVAGWIQTPQYQQKMLEFFEVAFQQNQSAVADFASQIADATQFAGPGSFNTLMLANYHEMFARTALELVAEGRPFTETYTTTRFMLTPALAASMAILDSQHYSDDSVYDVDENFQRYPGINVTFDSNGPVPSSELSDPTSPNYMHFFSSSVSPGSANPCLKSPVTYTPVRTYARDFDDTLFIMMMGSGFRPSEPGTNHDPFTDAGVIYADGGNLPPGACDDLIDTSTLAVSDFSHWRMVTIRKPGAGEVPTPYWDSDTLRSGTELLFNIERVGFFTTPSFLASWNTNTSNQARVTINQTLIVALNQAFDGTDGTQPLSTAAVDEAHLLPGCINCHRQLDPMRQFFRHDYTIPFHEQIDAGGLHETDAGAGNPNIPPQFVWGGVAQQGSSIADLARLLTQQSNVAAAWAQKLCQWGNSATCDASDPEFQRIVGVFQSSHFDWSSLVIELFSSPIVTYLEDTQTADTVGETFPIARQGHLCALLSNRLGIADICGLSPATSVPYNLRVATTVATAYPSDQFSRGQVSPSVFVLANDPNLFTRTGLENLCLSIATSVVDAPGSKYSSHQSQVAISDFVYNLMGLTGDRATPMLQLLTDHYNEALTEKGDAGVVTPTVALRSTFTLACLSPYVVGLGQ